MPRITVPRGKLPRLLLAAGLIVAVLVVATGFLYVDGAFQQDPEALLRHQGGYRITLQARCTATMPECDVSALLPTLSDRLTSRVHDGLRIAGGQVRQHGDSQVVVYLPGLTDASNAVRLLSTPGLVQIIDTGSQYLAPGTSVVGKTCPAGAKCDASHFSIVFDNSEVDPTSVAAQLDPQSGRTIVTFAFLGTARDRFAQYTHAHIGEYLTIVLDGAVIESDVIQSEIDGSGEISGLGSMDDAQRLAAYLKDGTLPLAVDAVSVTHVAPAKGA